MDSTSLKIKKIAKTHRIFIISLISYGVTYSTLDFYRKIFFTEKKFVSVKKCKKNQIIFNNTNKIKSYTQEQQKDFNFIDGSY